MVVVSNVSVLKVCQYVFLDYCTVLKCSAVFGQYAVVKSASVHLD